MALVCDKHISREAVRAKLEKILPKECLSQPVSELSGGMKRRVALARAMAYPGSFIIMDEPFTGLDVSTKKEVINYILNERNSRIMLISTHSEEDVLLLGADKIRLEDINKV